MCAAGKNTVWKYGFSVYYSAFIPIVLVIRLYVLVHCRCFGIYLPEGAFQPFQIVCDRAINLATTTLCNPVPINIPGSRHSTWRRSTTLCTMIGLYGVRVQSVYKEEKKRDMKKKSLGVIHVARKKNVQYQKMYT